MTRSRFCATSRQVKATLVLASAKGGTGKSLLAVNIAGALAARGQKGRHHGRGLNAPSILQMLGVKAPLRYLSSEGIEPAAAPLGIRVIAAELLTESLRPAMSFLDEDAPPAPVAVAPVQLIIRVRFAGCSLRRASGRSIC